VAFVDPSKDIRPASLDGIKRLAKSIKRGFDIPHHQALDAAAKAAGYENFGHARNVLANQTPPSMDAQQAQKENA
jgi:hypothetical protein